MNKLYIKKQYGLIGHAVDRFRFLDQEQPLLLGQTAQKAFERKFARRGHFHIWFGNFSDREITVQDSGKKSRTLKAFVETGKEYVVTD